MRDFSTVSAGARVRWGLFGLGLALSLAVGALGCSQASDAPGRIILVSMDTVRADRVSGYADVPTMPELAAIASDGVRLQNFYAASSYTLPSHMSIFTGLDAAEHGMMRDEAELSPRVVTLGQALADAGYRPAAFHEGGYVSGRFGFERGFEQYRELGRLDVVGAAQPSLVEWLRRARDERYFLFVHTYAAHFPYGGFERYREQHPERGLPRDAEIAKLRERHAALHAQRREGIAPGGVPAETRMLCTLYNQLSQIHSELLGCGDYYLPPEFSETPHAQSDVGAMLESYDERIGQIDGLLAAIRDTLVAQSQWDDTLLVVTADHGEAFLEHGASQHDYIAFNEVLKVPAVISFPARLQHAPEHVIRGLTWQLDLMPTILGLAGVAVPEGLRGRDLTPVLEGREALPGDRAVYPSVLRLAHRESRPLRRVVLRGSWKLVEGDPHFGDPDGLLFDLALDPDERKNLRSTRPDIFRELSALADDYESGLDPRPPIHQASGRLLPMDPLRSVPGVELTPEQAAALRELGYVD